jgi:pimeloyl-ACP methyl ester carboxylesterase
MPDKNLVFIHGFGSVPDIWAKLIQRISDDPDLSRVQTFTFGYPSPKMRRSRFSPVRIPDYLDIAQSLATYLDAGFGDGDLAVVTHSQGGLIMQQFLAWMLTEGRSSDLARIRLFVMLVCPNEGSKFLSLVRTVIGFRHHPQARYLYPLTPEVIAARRRVLTHVDKAQGVGPHHCKIPIYAYAGDQDNVVSRDSAQDSFTNTSVLHGNHSTVLDPDSVGNFTFPVLKGLLHTHLMGSAEIGSVPDVGSRAVVAGGRAVPEASSPLLEEALELTVISEGIQSVRVTDGKAGDRAVAPVPPAAAMADYHRALAESAALTAPPDDATSRRIRGLVLPVQRALLLAIPESVRRRIAAGSVGRPAAIELRLMNSELESYPWEVLTEAADVVVWRKVLSAEPAPPPRWTSNLLVTGRADMQEVRDELTAITSALSGSRHLTVIDCPDLRPDLPGLLRRYSPTALHLVSYLAGQPRPIAMDLRRYGVWAAVFSCPDSASPAAAGSGAVTIGMAGRLNPGAGRLFAVTFYQGLAGGSSVLRAYHQAVQALRDHGTYSAMWSIPVMHADSPNVIPFPVSPEAQARLGLEQIRVHATVLDRELQRLARGNYRTAGEWANHTAIPIVRTQCLVGYLDGISSSRPVADEHERRHQERVDRAREEFRRVLRATEASLRHLRRAASPTERREALRELPLRLQQQRRNLDRLDDLVNEAR